MLFSRQGFAQASSPFSAFGLGEFVSPALVNNQGMAGVGVSNPQYWYLNNINPAMLVNNRLTTFQAGILLDQRNIQSGSQSEKSKGGNVAYMALGFPMKWNRAKTQVNWSSAIGLMPYTTVNYRIESQGTVPGTTTNYFREENASGGFNQIYWSHGVRILPNLSVGLKGSYLFSSVISNYSVLLNQATQTYKYLINLNEIVTVSGGLVSPSFHYRIDSVGGRYALNIGATGSLARDLPSKFFQKFERRNAQGEILESDSLQSKKSILNLPSTLTAGVSFGNPERWTVGVDYTLTRFAGNTTVIGADRYNVTEGSRIAVGAEITPDGQSLTSLLKRMTYRTGVSVENSAYLVNGTSLRDVGINFGLSLPVNRISSLDLAFRYGKRGDKTANGLTENYFKVYFGITFNDQWFIKSRYD